MVSTPSFHQEPIFMLLRTVWFFGDEESACGCIIQLIFWFQVSGDLQTCTFLMSTLFKTLDSLNQIINRVFKNWVCRIKETYSSKTRCFYELKEIKFFVELRGCKLIFQSPLFVIVDGLAGVWVSFFIKASTADSLMAFKCSIIFVCY